MAFCENNKYVKKIEKLKNIWSLIIIIICFILFL